MILLSKIIFFAAVLLTNEDNSFVFPLPIWNLGSLFLICSKEPTTVYPAASARDLSSLRLEGSFESRR